MKKHIYIILINFAKSLSKIKSLLADANEDFIEQKNTVYSKYKKVESILISK